MNKEDFSKIAQHLRPGIVSVSFRFLKDEAEAEDNTQDTLLKLWMIKDRLHEYKSVDSLAIAICKNLCISKIRRRKIIPIELDEEIAIVNEYNAQSQLEDKENSGWLAEKIDGLPASQMQILKMSQQEGLSNSDIALILGINETTVRTAICKARKSLLDKLKKRI